jgi:hypothetical protein
MMKVSIVLFLTVLLIVAVCSKPYSSEESYSRERYGNGYGGYNRPYNGGYNRPYGNNGYNGYNRPGYNGYNRPYGGGYNRPYGGGYGGSVGGIGIPGLPG